MNQAINSLPLIASGISAVTVIDTLGAWASRRLQFNYSYLIIFSLIVYTLLGYYGASITSNKMVVLASLLVGAYDATVGFKLSKMCRANLGIHKNETEKVTYTYALMIMAIIAPLFSGIGYALSIN